MAGLEKGEPTGFRLVKILGNRVQLTFVSRVLEDTVVVLIVVLVRGIDSLQSSPGHVASSILPRRWIFLCFVQNLILGAHD